MNATQNETMIVSNKNQSVEVYSEHCGVHVRGGTAVYPTIDGRYAVVNFRENFRLIKIFSDKMHARRYNFKINGDSLD